MWLCLACLFFPFFCSLSNLRDFLFLFIWFLLTSFDSFHLHKFCLPFSCFYFFCLFLASISFLLLYDFLLLYNFTVSFLLIPWMFFFLLCLIQFFCPLFYFIFHFHLFYGIDCLCTFTIFLYFLFLLNLFFLLSLNL